MTKKLTKRSPSPARGRGPGGEGSRGSGGEVVKKRGSGSEVLRSRATSVLRALKRAYPDAHCALDHKNAYQLDHKNAYQLLAATILSAQCTDVRVNLVTPELFRRFPTPAALAHGSQAEVEEIIRSTGFFRNKAKNLIAMAQALVADHGGEVPETMDSLHALPGVGRKTANVVLGNWYGINEGITVDTHVTRIARLLKLTKQSDAVKIERELMALFPRADWTLISHLLISHGRAICIANRPKCGECVIAKYCPSRRVP
jgi:endonuclease-3